jgi:glycosyltransferase involved in cell wall biosynthesis
MLMNVVENNINSNLFSMENNDLVSIIIPVLNEQESIGIILDLLQTKFKDGYEIVVVDGGSVDGTTEIVMEKQVKLIRQKSKGYENAVIEGIRNSNGNYVVIIDADKTYDPYDIDKMLYPLFENNADFVIGIRYNSSIKIINRPLLISFGYYMIKSFFTLLFNINLSDPESNFRAIRIIDKSLFINNDFNNTYETIVILKDNDYRIEEIPIKYYNRIGTSKTHPISDGIIIILRMFKTWYKLKFGEKNE